MQFKARVRSDRAILHSMVNFYAGPRPHFSRLARRRREKYLLYILLGVLGVLTGVLLVGYFSQNPKLLIGQVTVAGNQLVSTEEIVTETNSVLEGKFFWLFPRRNMYLFPKQKLVENLEETFPALREVVLNRPSLGTRMLLISVRERTPHALWCNTTSSASDVPTASFCYFLDTDGLLFSPAPDFSSGGAYLRFVGNPASSTPPSLGSHLFPTDRFQEISFFMKSLPSLGLVPQTVTIKQVPGDEIDFTIGLTGGVRILISGARRLESTLSDMSAFFNDPEIATSNGEFLDHIQYIDFRSAGKVYYK